MEVTSRQNAAAALLFARFSLFWIVIAAAMGVWLRWQQAGVPPWYFNFRFLTHGHSHLMFLGWAFNALAAGITLHFCPPVLPKAYRFVVWALQIGIAGMAVAFPWQGYGAISIAFSSYHMLLTAWMGIYWWRNARDSRALKWALAFFFISALGPMGLGITMAKGMQDTIWYKLAVYFYLHFQYNAWMLLALVAIGLRYIGADRAPGVPALAVGAALSYAFSAFWTQPPEWVYVVAAAGAALQLAGAWTLSRYLWSRQMVISKDWSGKLLTIALVCWGLKLLFQMAALIPELATRVFENRNWLIAYFHWMFLGVISSALFALFIREKWLPDNGILRIGIAFFLVGFAGTEAALMWPVFPIAALLLFAAINTLGCFLLIVSLLRPPNAEAQRFQL